MEEIIDTLNNVFYVVFLFFTISVFYLSLKKCFLHEGKSKVKLFIMTVITQPIIIMTLSIFAVTAANLLFVVIRSLSKGMSAEEVTSAGEELSVDPLFSFFAAFPSSVIFVLLMILFSRLVGKWLKACNTSLVTFVYMMFSVIYSIEEGSAYNKTMGNKPIFLTLKLVKLICAITAVLLMHIFVIKALSKLTDRKRNINWKLFVFPPSLFIPVYTTIDIFSYQYGDIMSYTIAQALSLVILFLFIWAFYIIIKNINMTNVALDAMNKVKCLSVEVMEALAHTIDAKDKYTNGHSVRVAKYSRMIAEMMGLSAENCESIYYMGLLHDIGKIGISNEIIHKPSKLTDEEYTIIKTHPNIGFDILAQINSRPDLAKGARWHHERYDGRGYPEGISGEDIPIEARIIAVADSYDAMTSNRSYRQYLPQETVRSEIENNIGTQFDPDAARCMLKIIDDDVDYELHE